MPPKLEQDTQQSHPTWYVTPDGTILREETVHSLFGKQLIGTDLEEKETIEKLTYALAQEKTIIFKGPIRKFASISPSIDGQNIGAIYVFSNQVTPITDLGSVRLIGQGESDFEAALAKAYSTNGQIFTEDSSHILRIDLVGASGNSDKDTYELGSRLYASFTIATGEGKYAVVEVAYNPLAEISWSVKDYQDGAIRAEDFKAELIASLRETTERQNS